MVSDDFLPVCLRTFPFLVLNLDVVEIVRPLTFTDGCFVLASPYLLSLIVGSVTFSFSFVLLK